MSVVTVTKKIYEQVVALVHHLQPSTEEEALQQEISGFFAVKQRKQRTKKEKAPKVDMPQCCARVWDRKNEDGTVTRGVGGCCSKHSTGEVFEFNNQTFHFCKKHGVAFNNNKELAVNPRFERTEAHSVKTQKKAEKLGFENWQPVLWLGIARDSEGNEIERPLPADCKGEFNQAPLRWTDIKHSRKARKSTKNTENTQKKKKTTKKKTNKENVDEMSVDELANALEDMTIDNKETTEEKVEDVKEETVEEETVEESIEESNEEDEQTVEEGEASSSDDSDSDNDEEDNNEDQEEEIELEGFTYKKKEYGRDEDNNVYTPEGVMVGKIIPKKGKKMSDIKISESSGKIKNAEIEFIEM